MEEARIIRVTGKGQLKLRPDTTRITMTLSGVYKEYADALEHSASPMVDWEWSMHRYENSLADRLDRDEYAREAWDELEKSVVKNVADDVKVAIRNGSVEMIILKKLA